MKLFISLQRRRQWVGYLFILPWVIGGLYFFAVPFVRTILYSFNDLKFTRAGLHMEYLGLKNYREALWSDTAFVPALLGVVRDTLTLTPMILIFSLFVAVLLNQKLPARGLFRAWYFLPVIIMSGIVIDKLDNANGLTDVHSGPILALILQYGGPVAAEIVTRFLENVTYITWSSGVQILIFIAGLQGIPPAMYEAAKVDGASAWERFWKITLPMVSPLILLNFVYTLIDSFTSFNDIMDLIASVSFSSEIRLGYGSALSLIYFVITFVILLIFTAVVNRFIFYAEE